MRLMIAFILFATASLGADFAQRIPCEVDLTSGAQLKPIRWQQGITPLVQFDQLSYGRAVTADTGMTARMIIGQTSTGSLYAVTNSYAVTNNSFLVQWGTIGTNSASATNGAWWYTVYFEKAGKRYWTGNGTLYIEKTTSTDADGITWQPVTGSLIDSTARAMASTGIINAATANDNATNAIAQVIAESNRATIAEATLYPRNNPSNYTTLAVVTNQGFITGTVVRVESDSVFTNWLAGPPNISIFGNNAGYISAPGAVEQDPKWAAVSNAVTSGASLGATALQPASTNDWTVTTHDPYVTTNDTRFINLTGATVNVREAVQGDEPITLTQAGSLLGGILVLYASTNTALGVTNSAGALYYDARSFLPTHTNALVTVASVTSGQYMASWASNTGMISTIRGPGILTITSRMRITSTGGGRSLVCKPEAYILYGGTLTEPEIMEVSQTKTMTATMTDYITEINVPSNIVVGANDRLVIKWKAVTATVTPTWEFECGKDLVIAARIPSANSSALLTDAPADGTTYGRKDRGWYNVLTMTNGTTMIDGVLNGTNFGGWAKLGTNYVILLD